MERGWRSSSRAASPCRISYWRTSLLWIFSAIPCANGDADAPDISLGKWKPPHRYAELQPQRCAPSASYGSSRVRKPPTGASLQEAGSEMTMIKAPELEIAVLVLG